MQYAMNFFFHPSIHDVRKLPQEVTHIVIDLVETKKHHATIGLFVFDHMSCESYRSKLPISLLIQQKAKTSRYEWPMCP